MTQDERLNFLCEEFIKDSQNYKDIQIPSGKTDKRNLLRGLMNIRMPRHMDEKTIQIQDEYLKQRTAEKGITKSNDIKAQKIFSNCEISMWQGDITTLECDAIVNAANSEGLGCFVPMHNCIDNCIHSFAGIELRAECYKHMRKMREKYGEDYEIPTSEPFITPAFNLPAKYVIHVVGPIVSHRLTKNHEQKLAECYSKILKLCDENNIESVAFCCISTGVFGYPQKDAAKVAVKTVEKYLNENNTDLKKVIFNVFKDEDKQIYSKLLS